MRLLLDTCAFHRLAGQPAKLSAPVVTAINDSQNELFFSDTSIWEIVLKHAAGKLPLPEPPRTWIPKQMAFFQLPKARSTAEERKTQRRLNSSLRKRGRILSSLRIPFLCGALSDPFTAGFSQ